jgi:putative transposase
VEGAICKDHIHICVSIPPKESVSDFMGYLKGKFDRYPELSTKWNKSFWARGYYVLTIGNLTEEAIKKYIKEQQEESKRQDLRNK